MCQLGDVNSLRYHFRRLTPEKRGLRGVRPGLDSTSLESYQQRDVTNSTRHKSRFEAGGCVFGGRLAVITVFFFSSRPRDQLAPLHNINCSANSISNVLA